MTSARLSLLAGLLLLGCRSVPTDDFVAAEVLLRRGDLAGTLYHLDRVPPADPRYPRARAIAHATERRVRTTQQLLEEGLRLRAEWLDEQAAARFARALEIWPELELAERLLAATNERIRTLAGEVGASVAEAPTGEIVETRPVPPAEDVPAAPQGETLPFAEPTGEPVPIAEPAPPRHGSRAWLQAIDRHLERGSLEPALALAETGPSPMPESPTRRRLVQQLHQRALVHYGHGALELALADWARLLRIDPAHDEAREFAAAARAERGDIGP